MRIAIAGASGFVGQPLAARLAREHAVLALSRAPRLKPVADEGDRGLFPKTCNLFSLLDVEHALAGCDVGVYLVHSMLPPSRLTQGDFADFDALLADNFARAAKSQGLKRIVYLGGIIPAATEPLSRHLESRRETERILASTGVPLVTLRAGLVLGHDGSSFRIVERLVRRLPALVCPRWTRTRSQPIALGDALASLEAAVLAEDLAPGAYDIGGPDVVTYQEMMSVMARLLGKRRPFLTVPVVSPRLSKLWVSLVTGTPRALVYPLIDSLRHDMVVRHPLPPPVAVTAPLGVVDAMGRALQDPGPTPSGPRVPSHHAQRQRWLARKAESFVTSVQRLRLPEGKDVGWLVAAYARFLPSLMRPWIVVDGEPDGSLRIRLRPWPLKRRGVVLLRLRYAAERSDDTRRLFYLSDGLLLHPRMRKGRGRIEFRQVPGRPEALVAVIQFRPSLPWWVYVVTQAPWHVFVMAMFGRFVRAEERRGTSARASL